MSKPKEDECKRDESKKEEGTMSAAVRDFSYRVISKGKDNEVSTVTKEKMQALKNKFGKYLKSK